MTGLKNENETLKETIGDSKEFIFIKSVKIKMRNY